MPSISGNDGFERYFRAHQNTAERLVVFLPAIFAADTSSIRLRGSDGVGFVAGRGLYFRGYTDPDKSRSAGFAIGESANILMILSTLFVTVTSLL